MPAYLTFALAAPIASFGDLAIGERRTGWTRPARSAVIGLIGACLGLERRDEEGQAALAKQYGVALLCLSSGIALTDYHTTQVPSTRRGKRFFTRAEELASPDLNTVLSRRDYRVGAWHLAALWSRSEEPRWSLSAIADAMARPRFTPYLGRKSCPLGLPLAPSLQESATAIDALRVRHRDGPEATFSIGGALSFREAVTGKIHRLLIAMDDADVPEEEKPQRLRVESRRDQPLSRSRWQFDLRSEALLEYPAT
jgi:CRISPR system Cascade subunit CasD